MYHRIFLAFSAVCLLLFPASLRAEVVDRIVAVVNDSVITLSELNEAGTKFYEQVKTESLPSELEEKMKKARREVLENLIENKLLEDEMKKKKVEVTERDIDLAVEDILKQHRITENELKAVLARDGLTYSTYRQRIHDDLGKMRLVNREIKSKIVVKEEELRKIYQQRIEEFKDPEEVKVQQIFLPLPERASNEEVEKARQEALFVLGKARKGGDFAQLAREYSKGPEAREGGLLGFFKRKELQQELEESAFKLRPGAISDLIRGPDGFHIIRILEKKGGEPKPFAEVQGRIRDELLQAESERQFKEWIKDLRAKAFIEVRL